MLVPLRGASRAIRHRRATECAPRPKEVPARGSRTARPSGCVPRCEDRIVLARPRLITHSDCERSERVRRPRRSAHPSTTSSPIVRSMSAASTLELPSTPRSLRSQSLCAVNGLPPARDATRREVATRRPRIGQSRAPTASEGPSPTPAAVRSPGSGALRSQAWLRRRGRRVPRTRRPFVPRWRGPRHRGSPARLRRGPPWRRSCLCPRPRAGSGCLRHSRCRRAAARSRS